MYKEIASLFCVLLAITNASIIAPHDLFDEVEQQLGELEGIVQGGILVAHDDLSTMQMEWGSHTANIAQTASLALQQSQENTDKSLASVKELANSANADISVCLDGTEDYINGLYATQLQQMSDCISPINGEVTTFTDSARYLVDVVINKVHDLQFQVRQCGGSLECISPLVTEIQLDKVRLPQNIRTEIQATEGLLDTLALSVQSCSNFAVSQYGAQEASLFRGLINCVNRIINNS